MLIPSERNPIHVYVVTGRVRSGTSMMMHASIMGGMDAVYGNKRIPKETGYDPNPNGYFEGVPDDMPDFPDRVAWDGKLFKRIGVAFQDLIHTGVRAKAIFMMRDTAEVKASAAKMIGNHKVNEDPEGMLAKMREDVPTADIIVVNYADVIADPLREMTKLAEWGWPIDPVKAASVVNTNLYRHRINGDEVVFIEDE